jgi:TonB family protein
MQPGEMDVGLPDPKRQRFWVRFWLLIGGAVLALAVLIGVLLATGLAKVIVGPSAPERMRNEGPTAVPPAPTMDSQGRAVTSIEWRERPRPYYPEQAERAGIDAGEATLTCVSSPDGQLKSCEILGESPPGLGFGEAAAKAALEARVYPSTVDGVPQAGRMRFTVRFRLQ